MTHYCAVGNQPRVSGLVLTFADADHLAADWTHKAGGKENVGHFAYVRKR